MAKWKYCEVTVEYGGILTGVNANVTVFDPSGQANESREPLAKAMAKLGNNGWELVSSSIIQGSALGNRRVVHMFKKEQTQES